MTAVALCLLLCSCGLASLAPVSRHRTPLELVAGVVLVAALMLLGVEIGLKLLI